MVRSDTWDWAQRRRPPRLRHGQEEAGTGRWLAGGRRRSAEPRIRCIVQHRRSLQAAERFACQEVRPDLRSRHDGAPLRRATPRDLMVRRARHDSVPHPNLCVLVWNDRTNRCSWDKVQEGGFLSENPKSAPASRATAPSPAVGELPFVVGARYRSARPGRLQRRVARVLP
jgi:hypothetical protein